MSSLLSSQVPKTWSQLKSIVEYSRKLIFSLNNDVPSSIKFRQISDHEYRVYFLASNQKREVTIKYVNVQLNTTLYTDKKLVGETIFLANYLQGPNDNRKLTKEEQLLRERQRCVFSGITEYSLDACAGRFVFTERSELFCFDDKIPKVENSDHPIKLHSRSKGAIDVKICPHNSNIISYVLADNIWIQDLITKQEIKLTNTCEPLKSGVPSYAVQEEFGRYTGYWWFPSNKQQEKNADNSATYRIIYEETDETLVELTYITPSCTGDSGYDTYRYPRAGTPNSKVYLKIVEVTLHADNMKPPTIQIKRMNKDFYQLFNWFEYLTRADFTPDGNSFWVEIYDRLQCHTANILIPLDFFVYEESESMQSEIPSVYCLTEQISDTWINAHNCMQFLNVPPEELSVSFINATEESGFLHLYHYKVSLEGSNFIKISEDVLKSVNVTRKQITLGEWCVDADEGVCIDQINNLIYFHAYVDPTEVQFFVVDYLNPGEVKQLTESGFSNHVTINQQTNMFVATRSNLQTPSQAFIFQLKNQDQGINGLTVVRLAQMTGRDEEEHNKSTDNNKTMPSFDQFSTILINTVFDLKMDSASLLNASQSQASFLHNFFIAPEMFTFQTPDNCKLHAMIYKPFNYTPGQKYRTLLFVYGGPRAQLVTNAYKINKLSRLNILALLNYCVVVVDSRGSNNRGIHFESYLKHRMGTVEIADQVLGLEAASQKFGCVDMKRVAIFGWSYGGYMALLGLAQRPDIFKVAISGAPVTSWGLYDTAYTERYMGLPEVNCSGYSNGSVINMAKNFPDEENRLLIIHGMIDENVHFAHTRQFIDALVKEGKPYRLQIYPRERHGIRSADGSIHCDLNFYSFLEQNL